MLLAGSFRPNRCLPGSGGTTQAGKSLTRFSCRNTKSWNLRRAEGVGFEKVTKLVYTRIEILFVPTCEVRRKRTLPRTRYDIYASLVPSSSFMGSLSSTSKYPSHLGSPPVRACPESPVCRYPGPGKFSEI